MAYQGAHRLAELCATGAEACDLPALAARSAYIRLQTFFARDEFDAALSMARDAYEGYMACGRPLEALRTHLGRMSVLLELGLYQEALDAGPVVLAMLDGRGEIEVSTTAEQRDMLSALVQQNHGLSYEYMGRYEEALEAYGLAGQRYGTLGEDERVGEVLANMGAILLSLGRSNEALEVHEAARFSGWPGSRFPMRRSFATSGRRTGGSRTTRTASPLSRRPGVFTTTSTSSRDELTDKSLLTLDTANAYLDLDLYPEALAAYQKSSTLLLEAGMAHDRARALWGMGVALADTSNLQEAERALAEAAELFVAADNASLLSGVILDQSLVQEQRGEPEASLAHARRTLELVLEKDRSVQRVYAHLRMVDLLLPDVDVAEPHPNEARQLSERLALPQLRQRLNERLGRLKRLQGNDQEVLVALEEAIDGIKRLRDTVTHESMRTTFLLD